MQLNEMLCLWLRGGYGLTKYAGLHIDFQIVSDHPAHPAITPADEVVVWEISGVCDS